MADTVKKFLNSEGVSTLWSLIQTKVSKEVGIEAAAREAADIQLAKDFAAADKAITDKIGVVPENSTVMGIITNIQENAYDDTELRGLITDLESTHNTDKGELQGDIALKADKTALDEVSAVANAAVKQSDYDVKVKALEDEDTRIAGLVATEQARAEGVESGLEDRIETMEAFWAAAAADGTDSNVIDTLKEIQEYITSDETGAADMLAAIEANEKAIAKNAEDIGKNTSSITALDAAYQAADTALDAKIAAEAKSREDADKAINDVIGTDDTAGTLKGRIKILEDAGYQNSTQVGAAIDAKIAALDLANSYDSKGSAAQALTDAKAYADGLAGNYDAEGSAAQALVDAKAYSDANLKAAKSYSDDNLATAKTYSDANYALIQALSAQEIKDAVNALENAQA